MEREYKNIRGEVKELNEKGEGLIVFATLNVIDSDNDVTLPGAFGTQVAQMVPAHDWSQAPIGKANIREEGDEALAEIKLNLKTDLGRNWYEAMKFDLDNPPSKQEYSYGYNVLKESRGEFQSRQVRFLEQMKVHEISPVLLGAGINTRTLALKQEKKTTLEEDIKNTREIIEKLITRVGDIKELREKDGRAISKERIKELIDIEGQLLALHELLEPPDKEQNKVIIQYHDLEKRLLDFRKALL